MDKARKWTDKKLEQMEKDLTKTYSTATKELKVKWKEFMNAQNAYIKDLQDAYYTAKRAGFKAEAKELGKQLGIAKRDRTLNNQYYKDMVAETTKRLAEANQTALNYINGQMPSVYITNYNEAKNIAEDVGMKFTLINDKVVNRMVVDGDITLPKKKLNISKDMQWNTKKLNSSVLQGIIQGESMDAIADRILPVVSNNAVSAIRNARTMVTGAENRGRIDSYKSLEERGAVLKKVWMATPDERTRESHIYLDGQEVEVDDPFIDSDGYELMFPADPTADPATVYNCRCTMTTHIIGFRRADGTISEIDYDGEPTMHDRQMEEEKERRQEEEQNKPQPTEKSEFLSRLENWGIDYKEVKDFEKTMTENAIINRLGGGDMTMGSCASLSFAYAGNKKGYNVLDFRGGSSLKFFSKEMNIRQIAELDGVKSNIVKNFNDFKGAETVLKDIPEKKEYILSIAKHVSIVKKEDGKYYYLELQSAKENGFKQLTQLGLKHRFGCQKSHTIFGEKYEAETVLIDVESLGNNREFKRILGYINTDEGAQKKGVAGHVR